MSFVILSLSELTGRYLPCLIFADHISLKNLHAVVAPEAFQVRQPSSVMHPELATGLPAGPVQTVDVFTCSLNMYLFILFVGKGVLLVLHIIYVYIYDTMWTTKCSCSVEYTHNNTFKLVLIVLLQALPSYQSCLDNISSSEHAH